MAENENNLSVAGVDDAAATGEVNEPVTNADDANVAAGEVSTASPEVNQEQEAPVSTEEITYHAVEKEGHVTAIWEMQGRKHLRTIDPRSRQGQEILRLYTSEHHDEMDPTHAQDAASTQEATAAQDTPVAQQDAASAQ